VRRMLVYERPDEGALVLGAGVPEAWVRDPPGVRVTGLRTHYGRLEFTIALADADLVRVTLGGDAQPPGGVVITSPLAQPLRAAVVDGRDEPVSNPHQLALPHRPAEVLLLY